MHGDLFFVVFFDLCDISSAGDFTALEVLNEKTFYGVAPQGTVKEVSGADGIDFDFVRNKFESEALGQTDSTEFTSCISTVAVGTDKTGFGVDLNDISPEACGTVLERHDTCGIFAAEVITVVVDVGNEVPVFFIKCFD